MSVRNTLSAGLAFMGGFLGICWATTWRIPVDRARHDEETGTALIHATQGDLDRALILSVPGSPTQHSIAECLIAFNAATANGSESTLDPRGCVADRLAENVREQQAILDQTGWLALGLLAGAATLYATDRFWPKDKPNFP